MTHASMTFVGVLLGLLPGIPIASAQEPERNPALDAAVAETNRLLEGFVQESGIPGAVFGVSYRGQVLFTSAIGWADRERRIPATPSTQFRIASISKPMTAAAMARLYERGELDLDSPVQEYVPDFPDKGEPITARLLAGHLAGIRHNRHAEVWNTEQPHYATLREALVMFRDDPLVARPGSAVSYSTPGYTLLGAVIESAAGVEYREFMRRVVFDPLGMERTIADDPREDVPGRTAFYDFIDGAIVASPYMDHSYKLPAGGYLSTVGDLLAFGEAHLAPGYLREDTLRMLTTSQRTTGGNETGYGLGWEPQLDFEGRRTIGHGGNQPGARAQLVAWPDDGLVAVFLSNVRGAPFSEDEVWTVTLPFFEALESPEAWLAPPEIDVVGEYEITWSQDGGQKPLRVVVTDTVPFLRGRVLGPDMRTYRIVSGRVSGTSLRFAAVHPRGLLSMRFSIDGALVRGRMTHGPAVGGVQGLRVPSLNEARSHAEAERMEAAMEVLEGLVERDPDDGWAWYGLSRVHSNNESYGLAAEALERAAALGYDQPGSNVSAAGAWALAGEEERALDCLDAAMAAGFDALERLRGLTELEGLQGNARFEAFFAKQR